MKSKNVILTAAFLSVIMSIVSCGPSNQDDKERDDGQGIHYLGGYYPYGSILPNGRMSAAGGSIVSSGTKPTAPAPTTRGGFGEHGTGVS